MSFFQQHIAAITTRRPISSLSYANRTNYSSGSGKRSYQFGERNGQTNDIERGYGIMEATSVGGLFVSARIAFAFAPRRYPYAAHTGYGCDWKFDRAEGTHQTPYTWVYNTWRLRTHRLPANMGFCRPGVEIFGSPQSVRNKLVNANKRPGLPASPQHYSIRWKR
jgi:hypothetical protein